MKYDIYYVIGQLVNAGQDFKHRGVSRYPRRFNTMAHVAAHLKNWPLKDGENVFWFAASARGVHGTIDTTFGAPT